MIYKTFDIYLFQLYCRGCSTKCNMLTLLISGEGDSTEGTVGLPKAEVHLSHVASAV